MAAGDPRLAGYVTVDGELYGPGDDLPDSVVDKIGAHAWVDGKKPAPGGSKRSQKGPKTGGGAEGPPPMGGAGSGEDEWRAYAAKFDDVDLTDVDGRDGVIEALRAAGHPVEKQ